MRHRKHSDVVARHVFDEHLLVPVRGPRARENALFTLDAIGHAIWELLDGARDDAAVIAELTVRYPNDPARVARETTQFLDELTRLGLVEGDGGTP